MLPDSQGIVAPFTRVSNLKMPPTTSGRSALRNLTDPEVARLEPGDVVLRDCGSFWSPEVVEVVGVHMGIEYDRNSQPLDELVPVASCRVPSGVTLAFNAAELLYPSYVLPLPKVT